MQSLLINYCLVNTILKIYLGKSFSTFTFFKIISDCLIHDEYLREKLGPNIDRMNCNVLIVTKETLIIKFDKHAVNK